MTIIDDKGRPMSEEEWNNFPDLPPRPQPATLWTTMCELYEAAATFTGEVLVMLLAAIVLLASVCGPVLLFLVGLVVGALLF